MRHTFPVSASRWGIRSPKPILPLLTSIAVLAAGCVAVRNPARHPEPNDQELMVKVDRLYRGDEKLDEQDFYELAGDRESAAKIRAPRDGGERRQAIGATLLVIGVALVAAGLVGANLQSEGDQGIRSWGPWVGFGGGLALGYIGWQVRDGGKERARPDKPMFDTAHAQRSLEIGRYGAHGLTAASIKSLVLATADGTPRLCTQSGAKLADLVAKDAAGHVIKLDGHLEWFTWKTAPDGLLDEVKKNENEAQPRRHVRSPLRTSLAALGSDVTVTVSVAQRDLSQSLTLHQDFACEQSLVPASGKVVAEVAFVSTPDHPHLLLVATDGGDWAVVGPGGRIMIDASGADGDTGERGDDGESFSKPHLGFSCAGRGGPGGDGRQGGPGRRGGTVVVRAANKAALEALEVTVKGGRGGDGGPGGDGGLGEPGSGCRGPAGKSGAVGASGAEGPDGTLERSVVAPARLTLIAKLIATNPALTLDR